MIVCHCAVRCCAMPALLTASATKKRFHVSALFYGTLIWPSALMPLLPMYLAAL